MTKNTKYSTVKKEIILISIGAGVIYWVFEAAMDAFIFHERHFIERILPSDPNELWMRSLVVCLFIAFSVYAGFIVGRLMRSEKALRSANQQLQAINQQLRATEQQLRAANQQLQASEQQLKAANQQLRASEEKSRALAKFPSENPNPVLRITSDGIVIYTNNAGLDLLNTWNTDVGKPLPRDWHKFTAGVFKAASSKTVEFEYDSRVLNLSFTPVVDENYINIYALDITERKQAEEALEVSNCELKDFVYIASHDLREPLRKISSFGELLKDSLEGKLNRDDQENLEFMVDGANRMTEMIEGLLMYSRVNTKGISFQAVNLNEVAEQLEQLELAVLLEETGGTIEVPQPLPVVEADPIQMRQLLQNLIANGIRYRRDEVRPRIVIRAKHTDEDKVRIEVQDNGIGIEEEHYEDIFTMFRRLHPRQRYGGTGIGLAVCRKIVDRHGGRIGVESKYGEGTTLWFTLSAASEAVVVS